MTFGEALTDSAATLPCDETYVVCCTERPFICEDDDYAIPLAVCEERILARDPNCQICALVGHLNLQDNDVQESISLVQTSHSLVSSAPQSFPDSVFAPSSVPGARRNVHSTVLDHQHHAVDPPSVESTDIHSDAPSPDNPFRKLLHFPITYTPVFRHPPIKEVNIPRCTAYCSFCGIAVPPECLQTVDRDGCFAYCVPCLAVFSQTEDFSSHALAAFSNSAPLLLTTEDFQHTLHDSLIMHDSSLVEEFSSTSVPFSSELGSSLMPGNFSEFDSPTTELSQSAFAEGISICTTCDSSVTFAPVAEELLAPHVP